MDSSMESILLIINDGPYGNERPYTALRLALNLVKRPGVSPRVFLAGDGVACARRGQTTPLGYYNVERIVKSLARRGEVALSGHRWAPGMAAFLVVAGSRGD